MIGLMESLPRLKIVFSFGRHLTKEDARKAIQRIKEIQPDLYSPENAAQTHEEAQKIMERFSEFRRNKKSLGKSGLKTAIRKWVGADPFSLEQAFHLVDQGIPVFPIERHADDDSRRLLASKAEDKNFAEIIESYCNDGKFEESMELAHKLMKHQDERSRIQNENFAQNALTLLPEILNKHPEFRKKRQIIWLVRQGSEHRPAYLRLKHQDEIQSEAVFDEPAKNAVRSQNEVRRASGLPTKPPTRKQLAQFLIACLIRGIFYERAEIHNVNGAEFADPINALSEEFSHDEVKQIIQPPDFKKSLRERLQDALAAKGINIPASKEEFMELDEKYQNQTRKKWGSRYKTPYRTFQKSNYSNP